MNFLTALSVMANGVREILPFIRYISQFVDLEFSLIKKQNRGQGVVCAATWYVVLIILVPYLTWIATYQDYACGHGPTSLGLCYPAPQTSAGGLQ